MWSVSGVNISDESSQIFSIALKAPSHSKALVLSIMEQRWGSNSGQLNSVALIVIVVIRMPIVALIMGEGSPTA